MSDAVGLQINSTEKSLSRLRTGWIRSERFVACLSTEPILQLLLLLRFRSDHASSIDNAQSTPISNNDDESNVKDAEE